MSSIENNSSKGRPVAALTFAICLIYSLNGGSRGNFGVMLQPLADYTGLSYTDVSFVMAVSQLLFGALQPVFGIVALKTSARTVLQSGLVMMGLGFLLTVLATNFWMFLLSFGILLGAGTAAVSFGMLLGVVSLQIPSSKSGVVSGLLNASSGMGTTLLAPVLTAVAASAGVLGLMCFLGLPMLLLIPVVYWLCRGQQAQTEAQPKESVSVRALFREAIHDRTYQLLFIGFTTCGFHMAILETHFFNQLTNFGFDRPTAAMLFSEYGILTMLGSAGAGFLCNHLRRRNVLGALYAARVLMAVAILVMPRTLIYFIPFIMVMGLTSDSTVSPVSGLTLDAFGPIKLATLLGILFLTHQVGCFVSMWLGGWLFDTFGTYDALWIADGVLAAVAAASSFMIREK